MYCAVALDMVAARSVGGCGVAPVMVWLRPGGGAPPKMFAYAASRWVEEEGPKLGGPRAYSLPWY